MGYDGPLDGHLTGVSAVPVEIGRDGDAAEFDITPPEHRISLDDVDDLVEGGGEPQLRAWRTAAPAGALALAGMVLSLLSLLGTHAATLWMQYREQVVYLNAGATGRPSAKQLMDPFRHGVGVQLALGAVAAAVSVAALLAARRRQECRRWVRDLALAALLVAGVGLVLNGYLNHSIDTVKLPPASDTSGF